MKNLEIKNSVDELNRIEQTNERINELGGITIEITQWELEKNEKSLRNLWDYNKRYNIHITGISGRGKKDKGAEDHLKQ